MGAQKKEEKDVRELFVATFTGTTYYNECTFVTFKNEDFMTRVCSTSTWVYYRVCHVPHTLSRLLLSVC